MIPETPTNSAAEAFGGAHTAAISPQPGAPIADAMGRVRLPNLAARWLQVFYAPGDLFARLRERPAWGAALLLVAIASVAAFVVVPPDLWEASFREQMLSAGANVPAGFDFGRMTQLLGGAGTALFSVVLAFVLAGLLTLIFGFVLGDDGRYVQYLSVVSHALLIAATGALLITPLKIMRQDLQLTLNVGLFFPIGSESYPGRVLRLLDLFMLWSLVVIGVGASKIDARRGWLGAAGVVTILWVGLMMLLAILRPPGT
jgi:hypothetical protein